MENVLKALDNHLFYLKVAHDGLKERCEHLEEINEISNKQIQELIDKIKELEKK
jgi:hypothetical protein